jgi:uncharacterized protein (TIGR03435 family)
MKLPAALIFCLACTISAQTAPGPQFEVATAKPNKSGGPGAHFGFDGPHRFSSENTSLKYIVQWAWNVRGFQIVGGPKWFDSDRFDIQAASEKEATTNQMRLMLQPVLEDRFQLKVHREKRDQPVYFLTRAKNGAKIQPLPDTACRPPAEGEPAKGCGNVGWGPGSIRGTGLTMTELVSYLSDVLERMVIDKTELDGHFDIDLKWTPDNTTSVPTETGPSVFTAIQEQLGLRLESSRAPADVLVIDRAEQPSEN